MAAPRWTAVTLEEIRRMGGYESTDAVRMALRRAGVSASGATIGIGKGQWPPKKLYLVTDVWRVMGRRIIQTAGSNPEVKEFCWEVFAPQIRDAAIGQDASTVFADKLDA